MKTYALEKCVSGIQNLQSQLVQSEKFSELHIQKFEKNQKDLQNEWFERERLTNLLAQVKNEMEEKGGLIRTQEKKIVDLARLLKFEKQKTPDWNSKYIKNNI